MDNQNPSGYSDAYASPDEQYARSDSSFDLFQMVNGISTSNMAFEFQSNTTFQDMNSISAPQLFRNNGPSLHPTQAPESHQNFINFQQMQAPLPRPHHISDPSTRGLSARPGQNTASLPKKPDEPDSACRPRLTPEQTQFLEEVFSHTPRPTTQQKKRHAADLGLTHEKVNNWFQNRRAKSKQMTRIRRELSIMTPGDIQMQHWNDSGTNFQSSGLSSPPQYPEPDNQSMLTMGSLSQISKGSMTLDSDMWSQPPSNSTSATSYTSNEDINTIAQSMGLIPDIMSGEGMNNQRSQQSGFSPLSDIPSDWIFQSGITTSPHTQNVRQNGVDMNQVMMLLQQNQGCSTQPWPEDHAMSNMSCTSAAESSEPIKVESVSSPHSVAHLHSQSNSAAISQHVTPQRSPSPRSQVPTGNPFSCSNSFARRDSTTSELANNFNTFHLQKVATHCSSDDEVFKTPKIPNLNLAARRKKERPAALMSMRTASTPNTTDGSPSSSATAIPPTAVRRIKSTGNSLNVFNRVHKSGASSAQRSPLAQTFREASALEKLHSSVNQMNEAANSDMSFSGHQSQASNSSPEASNNQPWATSPSDSLGPAPPLSATFTQNSYEEPSWVASPPVTPLYRPTLYTQGVAGIEVPQSAPAHMTQFPNLSPPPTTQSDTIPSYFTAQYNQDPSFYAPVPMPPPLHSQSHILKAYEMDQQQPKIIRPGSVGAHYGLFSAIGAAPQKEQKELEVVMASFPTPEARPRSLPRNNGNCVFTFQNTGPKDYASSD